MFLVRALIPSRTFSSSFPRIAPAFLLLCGHASAAGSPRRRPLAQRTACTTRQCSLVVHGGPIWGRLEARGRVILRTLDAQAAAEHLRAAQLERLGEALVI